MSNGDKDRYEFSRIIGKKDGVATIALRNKISGKEVNVIVDTKDFSSGIMSLGNGEIVFGQYEGKAEIIRKNGAVSSFNYSLA